MKNTFDQKFDALVSMIQDLKSNSGNYNQKPGRLAHDNASLGNLVSWTTCTQLVLWYHGQLDLFKKALVGVARLHTEAKDSLTYNKVITLYVV